MKQIALLTLLVGWTLSLSAADAPHAFRLDNGQHVEVAACGPRIFHIRIGPRPGFAPSLLDHYEILNTEFADARLSRKTQGAQLLFTTSDYQLRVDRRTGAMSVRNTKGEVVLSDLRFCSGEDRLVAELGESINRHFGMDRSGEGIIGDPAAQAVSFERREIAGYDSNSVLSFSLLPDERFYGGGNTSRDHIQHRGELLRIWTTIQKTEIPVPFVMSSRGWGVFNNTALKNYFDVGRYDTERMLVYNLTDEADFYLVLGESMPEALALYTSITGRSYLLPDWAYGFAFGGHMMEDQMRVMDYAVKFREEQIPLDLIWLEPQWMAKYYDYSTKKNWDYKKMPGEPYWCENRFPKQEHAYMFPGRLHALGYKLALWLCIDHDLSIEEEDYLAARDGRPLSGQEHWFPHLMNFVDQGVDGFKLDPGRTLEEHPDRTYYNGLSDAQMHNMNQILLVKQMYRTFREHKQIRSFHHYCGGYAGSQRYTANQSGDNGGGRTALFDQLNLGLSGFMNTSCDVLMDKNEMASLHMGVLLPWIQINSWFMLYHPWYYPARERQMYKEYIQLRYALFPYIYSAAVEGSQSGMPMARAMPLAFPDDRNVDDMVYQYMLGENLLVGVFSDSIYLPRGEWINYWTGERVEGRAGMVDAGIPANRAGGLFVRSGAIIPCQKPVQYIGERTLDTLVVRVWPGGQSDYTLYEDDGRTFGFEEGHVTRTRFACDSSDGGGELTVHPVEGSYEGMFTARVYELEIDAIGAPTQVTINGQHATGWEHRDGKLFVSVSVPDVSQKTTLAWR